MPLCRAISSVPGITELGITTNGIALKRKVDQLYAAGVTQFNISLDTLVDDKFVLITRKQGLQTRHDMNYNDRLDCDSTW